MDERTAAQIEALRAAGMTVIGSFERKGGGTVVLIVCEACGLARSPDHGCPSCKLRDYEKRLAEMRAALAQIRAGASALDLLTMR